MLHGYPLKVQRKEVGRTMPKRVKSENHLKSATTPERPHGFHALEAQHSHSPMDHMAHGAQHTPGMLPAPTTPSAHRTLPAAHMSPAAHWQYQVGGSPMMFPTGGYYSPSGYVPNMYTPGVYGGSVPTTPSGFPGPSNPYAAAGDFLAGHGQAGSPARPFAGPGFAGPFAGPMAGPIAGPMAGPMAGPFAGPAFAGPGLAGPGLGGHWAYNSSPAHGDPQSSGLETPTRSGAGGGMGGGMGCGQSQGGGGPDNTH